MPSPAPSPENHDMLDKIMALLRQHPEYAASREKGSRLRWPCVEFTCPTTRQRYEILVREVPSR
jgi:anti-sigma factor ChrR (cupin superfamily)